MDNETLILMQAVLTDEGKQKRFAEIMAATDAMNKSAAELKAAQDSAASQLRDAEAKLADARGMRDAAAQRHNDMDTRELEMGKVSDALNAEKRSFEEVRNAVDKDQREREAHLMQAEDEVAARENTVVEREAAAALREAGLVESEAALQAKHDGLHAALAGAGFIVSPDKHNSEDAKPS